jgi:hypothetical protein
VTSPTASEFPSDLWFSELIRRAKTDRPAMERLGIADLRFGIEIVADDGSSELFGIVLDGYDIVAVGRTDEDTFAPEVVLSGPIEAWRAMIRSIEANGRADAAQTLNSLSIASVPFEVRAPDAVGQDKFYRYMGTLQAIFDAAGTTPAAVARG